MAIPDTDPAPVREVVTITRRLPYREPMSVPAVLDFLGAHAIPGLERYERGIFARAVTAPGGTAVIELAPGDGVVVCTVRLQSDSDVETVVSRVRRLLDLDADPVAVDSVLSADPALAPLVAKRPGTRAPGCLDGFETAVRTIVGQQVSVSGARTVLGRIVAEHGPQPVEIEGALWRAFPSAATLAQVDPTTLPMPRARGRSVVALAQAFDAGSLDLDPGSNPDDVRSRLLALPGIGPWTTDYLLMRVLGHPDVLLDSDLVVRKAAADLGIDLSGGRPDWAPWRSYANYHLWAHLYADRWSARP